METQKISKKHLILSALVIAVIATASYLGSNSYFKGDANSIPSTNGQPDLAISDIYLDSSNKLTVVQSNLVHENSASADVTTTNGHTYIYIYKNSDGSLFKKWTYSWSTLSAVKSHPSYFLKAGETMNIQPMKLDSKDYTIQACIDPKNVVTNEYEESGSFDCAAGSPVNNFLKVNLNPIPTSIFKDKNLENAIREELNLASDHIITADDMLKLTRLEYLASSIESQIKDLTGLEYASNLGYLVLYEHQISDISALSGLIKLKFLNLYNNQITDISALSELTSLESLILNENQISDINILSRLIKLKFLNLYNNQITDISALGGLTSLESLILDENQISDINILSGLMSLEYLDLNENQISDISALSGLVNLYRLGLGNDPITDDSGNNQISDISALSGLINLTDLNLYNNQISDISVLSELTNLKTLYISSNQISDISALSALTNLKTLYIDKNQINDISALSGLINLTNLNLFKNQISDINALVNNIGISDEDTVSLKSNPLDESDCSDIQTLEDRGVNVTTDVSC